MVAYIDYRNRNRITKLNTLSQFSLYLTAIMRQSTSNQHNINNNKQSKSIVIAKTVDQTVDNCPEVLE